MCLRGRPKIEPESVHKCRKWATNLLKIAIRGRNRAASSFLALLARVLHCFKPNSTYFASISTPEVSMCLAGRSKIEPQSAQKRREWAANLLKLPVRRLNLLCASFLALLARLLHSFKPKSIYFTLLSSPESLYVSGWTTKNRTRKYSKMYKIGCKPTRTCDKSG